MPTTGLEAARSYQSLTWSYTAALTLRWTSARLVLIKQQAKIMIDLFDDLARLTLIKRV